MPLFIIRHASICGRVHECPFEMIKLFGNLGFRAGKGLLNVL